MLFSPPHSLEPMGNRHKIKLSKSDEWWPDTPCSVSLSPLPGRQRFLLATIQTKAAWFQVMSLLGRGKIHLIPTTEKSGLAVLGTHIL